MKKKPIAKIIKHSINKRFHYLDSVETKWNDIEVGDFIVISENEIGFVLKKSKTLFHGHKYMVVKCFKQLGYNIGPNETIVKNIKLYKHSYPFFWKFNAVIK